MKKWSLLIALFFAGFLLTHGCQSDGSKKEGSKVATLTEAQEAAIREQAERFFQSISTVKVDEFSPEKIELGKKLFHDVRLSKAENISCASCHNLSTYGVDNLPVSPGDTDEFGARNSPTVIYASLHRMQFWDGRAEDVEEQAGGPLLNPVEHALPSEEYLEEKLRGIEEYQVLFREIYPDSVEPITFNTITKAIGAFERQLNPISRFDEYLDGDDEALTVEEKLGIEAFIDAGCVTCHSGITLGGGMLQKFGLNDHYWKYTKSDKIDEGLAELTQRDQDLYIFKVPGLRNVAKTYPYFHDGSVGTLEEAIRVMGRLQVNDTLSNDQVRYVQAFMEALTAEVDEEFTM